MRRILIDHAREHQAAKRPGGAIRVTLGDRIGAAQPPDCELLLLDQALTELTAIEPRQAQIVEMRYFGGLSETGGRRRPVALASDGDARLACRARVAFSPHDAGHQRGAR